MTTPTPEKKYKKVAVAVDEDKARLLELANKPGALTDAEIKEAFGKTLQIATRESQTAEITQL